MCRAILLFPVSPSHAGHPAYSGIGFDSVEELVVYQTNCPFKNAVMLSDGTLYDVADAAQAIADR